MTVENMYAPTSGAPDRVGAGVEIVETSPVSDAAWDRTWSDCRYATFFHSRTWAEIWSSYTQGASRPAGESIEFSDGFRAVLPISARQTPAGLELLSSPAGTFGGWISTDPLTDEHARWLTSRLADASGGCNWRMNPYADVAPEVVSAATRSGSTSAIDLAEGANAAFRGWSKGHRAAAKQAARLGVTVRAADRPEDWAKYYELYTLSLARWGEAATCRYERRLFDLLAAESNDRVTLWLAEHDGRIVAGAVCFYAPGHAVYWHGAADGEAFPLRPVHRLVFEMSRQAAERGCRWLDLNPSGDLEGVAHFKRGFGPTILSAPIVQRRPASAENHSTWSRLPFRAAAWAKSRWQAWGRPPVASDDAQEAA